MNTTATLRLEWNGEAVKAEIAEAAANGLNTAAETLKDEMKHNVSVVGPPRSQPGEFPHIDTQAFFDSLSTDKATAQDLTSAAGVLGMMYNTRTSKKVDDYAVALEFRGPFAGGRPWAMRSLFSGKAEIWESFLIGMKAKLGATK